MPSNFGHDSNLDPDYAPWAHEGGGQGKPATEPKQSQPKRSYRIIEALPGITARDAIIHGWISPLSASPAEAIVEYLKIRRGMAHFPSPVKDEGRIFCAEYPEGETMVYPFRLEYVPAYTVGEPHAPCTQNPTKADHGQRTNAG